MDNNTILRLRQMIERLQKGSRPPETPRFHQRERTLELTEPRENADQSRHPEPASLKIFDGPHYKKISALYPAGVMDALQPIVLANLEGFRSLEPGLISTQEWLYLDIETTGLLGAGTLAFLIGLGSWTNTGFCVTQYLLLDRDQEESLLQTVKQAIEAHKTIVTFNGKSFDLPVLQNRFVLAGIPPPKVESHLDLLGLARNMGQRLGYGKSLKESVRRFVGVRRQGDIAGNVIPTLYFVFEKEKDVSVLEPVTKHNRLDVLDMVCLAYVFGQILTGFQGVAGDIAAFAGAGKLHYRKGNFALAKKCLGLASSLSPEVCFDRRLLAQVLRRLGDWPSAGRIWEECAAGGLGLDEDYLWLARYYEVHCSDFNRAKAVVEEAIAKHPDPCLAPSSLLKRKKRLETRIRARQRSS